MKLIKPSYEILSSIDRKQILSAIEFAGRTCYKSESKITEETSANFVNMIVSRGHFSVLEHQSISVKFICDRGVSHELVRHRLASFSQESTRYCNCSKDKFDNQLTFILPVWLNEFDVELLESASVDKTNIPEFVWYSSLLCVEEDYLKLIELGWKPEQARSILPNSLKTEIVVTANLREWREIFRQRTVLQAHPQMRELMVPLHNELKRTLPEIFTFR